MTTAVRARARCLLDRIEALEDLIVRFPTWADTRLALQSGMHRQTVRKVRRDLEVRGLIRAVDEVIKRDGTPYPYRRAGAR